MSINALEELHSNIEIRIGIVENMLAQLEARDNRETRPRIIMEGKVKGYKTILKDLEEMIDAILHDHVYLVMSVQNGYKNVERVFYSEEKAVAYMHQCEEKWNAKDEYYIMCMNVE